MVDERLGTLQEDLANGDVAAAVGRFDDATRALEEQATRETGLRTLARSVNARTEESAQSNTAARGLVEATMDAESKRLEFPVEFLAFAEGDMSTADFADEVDELVAAHESVEQRADQLDGLKGTVPLPKLVALFGPDRTEVPKGTTIEVDYTLRNIGTREIESIEFGVAPIEDVSGFDLTITPGRVDSLPDGDAEEATATGEAVEARTVTIQVTADAEDVVETERTAIEVIDKVGYLERALEMIVDLEEETEDKTGSSGGSGRGNSGTVPGMLNKLDTARRRVENLLHELSEDGGDRGNDQGPADDSIDGRIESVIELLEAYRNQVEGLAGSRLEEKEAGVLLLHASDVVDALQQAVEADA